MTQQERLLAMFEEKRIISNYELRSMQPPMFQFPVRIKELKEKGYHIEGEFDELDKKKYWYQYKPQLNRLAVPPTLKASNMPSSDSLFVQDPCGYERAAC